MIPELIAVYIAGAYLAGLVCGLLGKDEPTTEAVIFAWPVCLPLAIAHLILLFPYKLGLMIRGGFNGCK